MTSTTWSNAESLATLTPDPWQDYANWQDSALDKRREWMQLMGCDDAEIEEHCAPGQVADLDEEIANYNAAVRLQQL